MSSLIKLLVVGTLVSSSFLLAETTDEKIIKFEKERFSQNKRIKIKNISISTKRAMPVENWNGYIVDIEASMAGNSVNAKDIVFSDGKIIAPELYDINTGASLKDLMNPDLSSKYYDKSRLIAGNHNAKDKLVVFSDPLCPFCMDLIPDIIEHVKRNEDSIALYYYHFPLLRIHPAAGTLVKLMNLAKKDKVEDIELKVYRADWDKYFNSKEKNAKRIIDGFNKEFKTNYSLMDVNKLDIREEVSQDIKMGQDVFVQGTPTVFVNGKQDKSKLKYEMLGN